MGEESRNHQMPDIRETLFVRDRQEWRDWLQRHHALKEEIWLILLKKHVREPCVSYEEAVEEALCFGWIDGILKRLDDKKHTVRFTPRKPNSIWAESNKRRVGRLIRQKKMTEAGMALVRAAKASGQWQKAAEREGTRGKGSTLPADLLAALARNKKARAHFEAFAPSHKKLYIHWILDAKRPETRKRRIREVVKRSAQNKRPGVNS